jgi:hypothetical protein
VKCSFNSTVLNIEIDVRTGEINNAKRDTESGPLLCRTCEAHDYSGDGIE